MVLDVTCFVGKSIAKVLATQRNECTILHSSLHYHAFVQVQNPPADHDITPRRQCHSIKAAKRAISYYMPNNMMVWNVKTQSVRDSSGTEFYVSRYVTANCRPNDIFFVKVSASIDLTPVNPSATKRIPIQFFILPHRLILIIVPYPVGRKMIKQN